MSVILKKPHITISAYRFSLEKHQQILKHACILHIAVYILVFGMSEVQRGQQKVLCKLQKKNYSQSTLKDGCGVIMLFRRPTASHGCANMTSSWCHLFVISAFHQQGKMATEITVICWLAWLSVTSVSSVDRVSAAPLWNLRGNRSSAVICGRRGHTLPAASQQAQLSLSPEMLHFFYRRFPSLYSCYWLCRDPKASFLFSAMCVFLYISVREYVPEVSL